MTLPSATPACAPGAAPEDPWGSAYDGRRPWALARQVALRPEPFGALAYHFGTRRLSFLKSRALLAVVESLSDHACGDAACAAAGVDDADLPAYRQALGALAASGMIVPRSDQ